MVNFENSMLAGQLFGNYGMLEIYVNILSGIFLLVSSLAAIIISLSYGKGLKSELRLIGSSIGPGGVKMAERGLPGWQFILVGIFYTGLIGLGEVMKHLFKSSIAITFYEYLTIMSAPIALYFFYIGIKKHIDRGIEGLALMRFFLIAILFFIVIGGLTLATEFYSADLKTFFLYFIFVPVLILSVIVFKTAFHVYEKYLLFMPTVSAMVFSTSFLALVTIIDHLSIVFGYSDVYIVAQGTKDVLISVTAMSILVYGGAVRMLKKQRV